MRRAMGDQRPNWQVGCGQGLVSPGQETFARRFAYAKPGVHDNQSVNPHLERGIGRQSQPKQAAPVLDNQCDVFQVKPLDQCQQIVAVEIEALIRLLDGLVRPAKAMQAEECPHGIL